MQSCMNKNEREEKCAFRVIKLLKKSQGNNVAKVLIVNMKEKWPFFEVIEATSALPNRPYTLFVADEKDGSLLSQDYGINRSK